MDKVNHEDMQATNITSVHNCNNTHKRNGGYELVSLSGEYGKHLFSVVANMLNTNQNRLSVQSIDFINYYSEFFKLLYNTFYPLFYNLIYFNLSDLDSYITSIISAYYCILSELKTLEATLIPAAKNTYKSIECCINKLKSSVCVYANKLIDFNCSIKKITIRINVPVQQLVKLMAIIKVNYRINIEQLRKSVQSCLSEIKSTNFKCTELDCISNKVSRLESCIFSDIKLLVCLKFNIHKFIMFDENVCRLRRFIFGSVPRLESFIRKILVGFNKDIDDKKLEFQKVEAELCKLETCVQNKLDSLNKTILTGISIRGLKITQVIDVECKPPKLTDDECYKKYKCFLLQQKQCLEESKTKVDNLKFKDSIQKIKRGASWISELLFKRYFRCSLQSLSTQLSHNLITSRDRQTSNIGILDMNNSVMSVTSRIVIDESIFLLSRVYVYYKTKDLINETLKLLERCVCLQIYNRNWRDKIETFDKPFPNINYRYYNPIIMSLMMTHVLNYGNYMCLCLVVRYILLNDLYILIRYHDYLYMDLLSCMTRSYNKYSYSIINIFNLSKLMMLIITTLDKIILWMKNIYIGDKIHCYCYDVNSPYYSYLISIILFVSSLIENIWSMDTGSVRTAIEKISVLYSQLNLEDESYPITIHFQTPQTFKLDFQEIELIDIQKSSLIYFYFLDMNYTISFLGDILSITFKFDILTLYLDPIFALIYNYFFNITYSLNNIYHIFKKSFNLVLSGIDAIASNFLLIISKVKFKSILKDCECDKKCGKKLIMKLAIELMYNRCILITKNISKDMRLDIVIPASMSKNITLNKLNEMVIKYVTCWMTITKNNLLISNNYAILNNKNTVKSRNWGYDSQYEHDLTFSETTITTLRVPLTI